MKENKGRLLVVFEDVVSIKQALGLMKGIRDYFLSKK